MIENGLELITGLVLALFCIWIISSHESRIDRLETRLKELEDKK